MGSRSVITSLWYWIIKFGKGLVSYAGITATCLILYCTAITYFFYICATVKMDWVEFIWFKDKWRNAILGTGTMNLLIFYIIGVKSHIQKQFLLAFCCSIMGTYAIVTAVYFHWIMFPYQDLLVLDGGIGVTTIMIITSAIRHEMLD